MACQLDRIMESATAALMAMDYLTCESKCLDALSIARRKQNWTYYARILLPLQEARRQRRMIAAEGSFRFGSTNLGGDPQPWLERLGNGCIVVSQPHAPEVAHAVARAARASRRHVEVLYADNPVTAPTWQLRSYAGPATTTRLPAPPADMIDRWMDPLPPTQNAPHCSPVAPDGPGPTGGQCQLNAPCHPADWFLNACESLGDAALNQVGPHLRASQRVEALEHCLDVVADHEIIHQRLGDAAHNAQMTTSDGRTN